MNRSIWNRPGITENSIQMVSALGLQCTSLTLDVHVIINWHLSKQGICWPVSRDHIAGSNLQLIEVMCFLKLTADQVLVLDWIAGSCQGLGQDRANYCALIVIVQPYMMKRRRRQVELFSVLHKTCVILVTMHVNWKITSFSHSS